MTHKRYLLASSIGGTGTADRPLAGGSAAAGRTDEEIQIVFDRYKAVLYRLCNRAFRNDPTLCGQVVDRVLTFDSAAKDNIPAITIFYPIDFLPAPSRATQAT